MAQELSWIAAAALALCVGSFLNVVVYRLPRMLERDVRRDATETLASEPSAEPAPENYNLAVPRSACPHCGHQITAAENIPVFGWLALRGRCGNCQASISPRYPIVEAVTALLTVLVLLRFGFEPQGFAAVVLTWWLIPLALIDADTYYLPDILTLPLLWAGLLLNLAGVFTDLEAAVWGAIAGYLSLWSVYWLFKLLTGKEGMGYGDFKLLAALGAWLGWQSLPTIVVLSSLVGAVVGIALIALAGRDRARPIPFGPFLAAAGWLAMMWGDALTQAYVDTLGI